MAKKVRKEAEPVIGFEAEAQALKEEAKPEPKQADEKKYVTMDLPVPIKINGKVYVGIVKVEEKQANVIAHMVSRKLRSEAKITTSKNFMVERMANNTLVIKES